MAEHDIDAIGAEAAAMMKTMLQLATLVALRTRERGQKEAEQRVKLTQARLQQAKEMAAREVREAKAKDPRNVELRHMIERSGVVLEKDRAALERTNVELERDNGVLQRDVADMGRMTASAEAQRIEAERLIADRAQAVQVIERPTIEYDSMERRAELALELAEFGIAPELIEVRMLADIAQAKPPSEAARTPIGEAIQVVPELEIDSRSRFRERER